MSSHSSKSLKSEVKSLKSLLKQLSKDMQSISSKQLENEAKTNELTKAKDEKSQFSKNYILMHLALNIMIILGKKVLGKMNIINNSLGELGKRDKKT